jgi:tripartite-type tricarboxylate transporter receptor subunit TctC/uncharacterized membrane protein YphA (DoxX/SURF4 family)
VAATTTLTSPLPSGRSRNHKEKETTVSPRFDLSQPLTHLRILCGVMFIPHVAGKVLPPQPALGFFNAGGFPAPELVMYAAAAVELAACLGMVLAVRTRWAALLGALVLAVASVALLKLGNKSLWLWNLGGIEYPVFWAITCLFVAWTHASDVPSAGCGGSPRPHPHRSQGRVDPSGLFIRLAIKPIRASLRATRQDPKRSIRSRNAMPIVNSPRRTGSRVIVAAGLVAAAFSAVGADVWPAGKPITLISPYAPGGTTDVLARMLAVRLQDSLKQTVVVENKPGAGGNVGSDLVAKAKPDGYTLLLAASGPIVIAPSLFTKLPYKPLSDFTPIAPIARSAFVVTVGAGSGITSLKELVATGKTGTLAYASAGAGTPQHVIGAMFNVQAGTKLHHVPYRGSGPAINDLIAGVVPVAFENPVPVMPHVTSGRLKVLAITGAKRSPVFPDIPTVAEQGFGSFAAEPWYGLLGPANLPPEIVARLSKAIEEALASTEIKARLFALGAEPMKLTPNEFGRFVAAETVKWGEVVKTSGATID